MNGRGKKDRLKLNLPTTNITSCHFNRRPTSMKNMCLLQINTVKNVVILKELYTVVFIGTYLPDYMAS
jgi:hypothetical protein